MLGVCLSICMICLTYLLWYLEMQIVLVLFGLETSSSKKRGQTISFMAPEALIRLICLFSPLDFHWICSALPRYFQYLTFKNLFLTTLVYSITPTGIRNEVRIKSEATLCWNWYFVRFGGSHSFSDGTPMEKNSWWSRRKGRFRKKISSYFVRPWGNR